MLKIGSSKILISVVSAKKAKVLKLKWSGDVCLSLCVCVCASRISHVCSTV